MSKKLPAMTDANIYEITRAPLVVVDFWADWCGHCHEIKPAIERLAREISDRVLVVGAHVDQAPRAADVLGIGEIPAILFVRDGREVHRTVGPVPYRALLSAAQLHLGV